MPRAQPHPEDRLLNAEEAGLRVHLCKSAFWALAKENPILRAGRRVQGRRVFWRASAVALYIESLPSSSPSECNLGSYARRRDEKSAVAVGADSARRTG